MDRSSIGKKRKTSWQKQHEHSHRGKILGFCWSSCLSNAIGILGLFWLQVMEVLLKLVGQQNKCIGLLIRNFFVVLPSKLTQRHQYPTFFHFLAFLPRWQEPSSIFLLSLATGQPSIEVSPEANFSKEFLNFV